MTLLQLIQTVLSVSIALIVLGLGLGASLNDAAYLIRRPAMLFRSLFSMYFAMPAFAMLLAVLFDLHPAIKLAIVALALSPVPPFLPRTQTKGGGTAPYVVSLLVISSVLAIVIVPLGVSFVEYVRHVDADIPEVLWKLALIVTVPLVAGMVIHDLFPRLADTLVRPVSLAGTILMVFAFVPLLIAEWNVVWSMVGNGTLVVLVLFGLIGLVVGHVMGGPRAADRLVLALATASRHPGVALAVAAVNTEHVAPVLGVIIWHLIVGTVLSAPYVKWMHLLPAPSHGSNVPTTNKTARHSPPIR